MYRLPHGYGELPVCLAADARGHMSRPDTARTVDPMARMEVVVQGLAAGPALLLGLLARA